MLKKIRNPQDPISEEVEELKISTNRTTCAEEVTYRQIWKNKNVRKAAILGCGLQMFQQLCGINTVMYYSASIVRMAGFSNTSHSIWLSTITAAVNFGCTFIGIHFVDKKGDLLLNIIENIGFLNLFHVRRSAPASLGLFERRGLQPGLPLLLVRPHELSGHRVVQLQRQLG